MYWRPFDTAPKDGQRILAHYCEMGLSRFGLFIDMIHWDDTVYDGEGPCWRDRDDEPVTDLVSHWMPMPKSPAPDRIDVNGMPCWDAPCEEGLVCIFDEEEWGRFTQEERDALCELVDNGEQAWPTWPDIPNAA